jgi:hypothetical protein
MMLRENENAAAVVKRIAQGRLSTSRERPSNLQLKAALQETFADLEQTPPSEAELARSALSVLEENPEFREPIQAMLKQSKHSSENQRYVEPASIALATAAVLVLQTRVKFKVGSDGKWSIEIEKTAGSDGALKLLVQRLLPFLDK